MATLTLSRPARIFISTPQRKFAPVAQLDRVPDYESGGRTFESCRVHHYFPAKCPRISSHIGVDEAPHAIGKQDINLAWLDNRGHFSGAKRWVHHRLSTAIGMLLIIGRAHFGSACAGHPVGTLALVRNARSAARTTDARDPPFLGYGCHDMPPL